MHSMTYVVIAHPCAFLREYFESFLLTADNLLHAVSLRMQKCGRLPKMTVESDASLSLLVWKRAMEIYLYPRQSHDGSPLYSSFFCIRVQTVRLSSETHTPDVCLPES